MELSDKVRQLLPDRFDIDASEVIYLRTFDIIELPDGARTPTEYGWFFGGLPTKSFMVAVDDQIYMPGQKTIAANIHVIENKLSFGNIAYWDGHLWGYTAWAVDTALTSMLPHPFGAIGWVYDTPTKGVKSMSVLTRALPKLDPNKHWVQLARGEQT